MENNKKTIECVVIVILVILLLYCLYTYFIRENFDATTSEFVPVGSERYGLRGDLLRQSDIARIFISPYRNIRLNQTGNMMYESSLPPAQEGLHGCRRVPCTIGVDEYDSMDTCWRCNDTDMCDNNGNGCNNKKKIYRKQMLNKINRNSMQN